MFLIIAHNISNIFFINLNISYCILILFKYTKIILEEI